MKYFPFILLLVLSACAPSAGAIQTAIAQTEIARPTATATEFVVPHDVNPLNAFGQTKEQTLECVRWDEVDPGTVGDYTCVQGNVLYARHIEDSNSASQYTLIRFTDDPAGFYVVQRGVSIDMKPGDCISVLGELRVDLSGHPFIKDGDLGPCSL